MKKISWISIVFLVFPVIFFMFVGKCQQNILPYHVSGQDPSYPYLLNTLNIADGKFVSGHFDHPGSTAHLIGGAFVKVLHIIHGTDDIRTDVLNHPEFYMQHSVKALQVLIAVILFLLGFFGFYFSKNLLLALLLQFSPFFSPAAMYYSDKIIAEPFLLLGSVLLIISVVIYLSRKNNSKYDLLGLSFSSAFLIASKFSSFPLLLIPLLIIRGKKSKLKFAGLSLGMFLILIIPTWSNLDRFISFIGNIITHSGLYGMGEEKVIDQESYFENLLSIITELPHLSLLYAALLILSIHAIIKYPKCPYTALLVGCTASILLQILIVSKHFSFHYLLPGQMILGLGIYAALKINFPDKWNKIHYTATTSLLLILFSVNIYTINNGYYFYKDFEMPMDKSAGFIESQGDIPLITERSNLSPVIQTGLFYGNEYSGPYQIRNANILKMLYPATYFLQPKDHYFSARSEHFYDWQVNYTMLEILSLHKEFNFYSQGMNLNDHLSPYLHLLDTSYLIYENPSENEKITRYIVHSEIAKNLSTSIVNISSDLESLSADGSLFLSSSAKQFFDKAYMQSNEARHSGDYSTKLTKKDAYSCNTKIHAIPGALYKFEMWRKTPRGDYGVMVATNGTADFYRSSVFSVAEDGDWDLVQLKFTLPKTFNDSAFDFYIWNNSRKKIYFDDFNLEIFIQDSLNN